MRPAGLKTKTKALNGYYMDSILCDRISDAGAWEWKEKYIFTMTRSLAPEAYFKKIHAKIIFMYNIRVNMTNGVLFSNDQPLAGG